MNKPLLAVSAIFLGMAVFVCGVYVLDHPPYIEQYILSGQYIGDIEDDGVLYEDVLIMDVIVYDPDINQATKETNQLYFVREDEIRDDLTDGTHIYVTWRYENGRYQIRSVSDTIFK